MYGTSIIASQEESMNPLRGKAKILAIASIVLIITISYGLFFYLQGMFNTEGLFFRYRLLRAEPKPFKKIQVILEV